MRKLIIIAILAAAASPAISQNRYIDRADGQVILEPAKCQGGGQQATFIENRSFGGGAYGCWEFKGDSVIVRWTHLVGPTGSILPANFVEKYPAPTGLR